MNGSLVQILRFPDDNAMIADSEDNLEKTLLNLDKNYKTGLSREN